MTTDLLIVGGGVAGLAAAWHVATHAPHLGVTLLEASGRFGGKVDTRRGAGFWVDVGPDVFVARRSEPADLARAVGLGDTLQPVGGGVRIARGGKLYPLPAGWSGLVPGAAWPLIKTPLLPVPARLRAMAEPLVKPRREKGDESLQAFFTRRFGRLAYERLIEPLVGGLYGADLPISLQSTLPHLHAQEQAGGVLRAWRDTRTPGGAPFLSLGGGMDRLVAALHGHLERADRVAVQTGVQVTAVHPAVTGYRVEAGENAYSARAVIVALPAPAAARVLDLLDPPLSALLAGIPHGSVGAVALGYEAHQVGRSLGGATGILIPRHEGGPVQAITLYSSKHSGSAPEGHVLFRVFMRPEPGGSLAPDDTQIRRAQRVLKALLDVEGAPVWQAAHSWHEALPRFTLGHGDRMESVAARLKLFPGLALAGAPYQGAGLPDAIASALEAARHLTHYLTFATHVDS